MDNHDGPGRDGRERSPRILVVEDHADSRDVLTLMLGERFRVWGCGSAAEALRALEAVSPDALLLDIGMAPVDGLQCLQAIRSIPRFQHVPAVALTGFARDVERQAFLAGGFQAVVTKPVGDHDGLIALIEAVLAAS